MIASSLNGNRNLVSDANGNGNDSSNENAHSNSNGKSNRTVGMTMVVAIVMK